jgi:lipoic acid synthetase
MDKDPTLSAGQKGASKTARIPIKIAPSEPMRKPAWIRVRAPEHPGEVQRS